jgi:zinc transporter, ZIP family
LVKDWPSGSAYAVGALAVGAALVVGFALHNLTEGLAIVAPLTNQRPPIRSLIGLGAVAGAPAILGAVIGAAVDNAALTAVLRRRCWRDHPGHYPDLAGSS